MSVRMRHTKSQTRERRSHHALSGIRAVKNAEGKLILPHRVDESTGIYRGRQIFVAEEKSAKTPKSKAEKKEHKHEHAHKEKDTEGSKGFFGKLMNARPKARSGAGGGGS